MSSGGLCSTSSDEALVRCLRRFLGSNCSKAATFGSQSRTRARGPAFAFAASGDLLPVLGSYGVGAVAVVAADVALGVELVEDLGDGADGDSPFVGDLSTGGHA